MLVGGGWWLRRRSFRGGNGAWLRDILTARAFDTAKRERASRRPPIDRLADCDLSCFLFIIVIIVIKQVHCFPFFSP